MMYALLALGFTMVYGIIELINFSHFSVFMTGTFVGLTVLNLIGFTAVSRVADRLALVATLIVALPRHHGRHRRCSGSRSSGSASARCATSRAPRR